MEQLHFIFMRNFPFPGSFVCLLCLEFSSGGVDGNWIFDGLLSFLWRRVCLSFLVSFGMREGRQKISIWKKGRKFLEEGKRGKGL